MKRNVQAIIEKTQGTIPPAYDLTVEQWRQLTELAASGITSSAKATQSAFLYGFAMGRLCEKRNRCKK